jgi:hypothetical protein
VWGGNQDPVHFQYPGFVVPAIDPTAEGLPWWASLVMPGKALDTGVAMEKPKAMFHDVWCGWFPNSKDCR